MSGRPASSTTCTSTAIRSVVERNVGCWDWTCHVPVRKHTPVATTKMGRWIRLIVDLLEERVWRSIHPLTAGRVPMFFEHLGHTYSIYCVFLQSCQYGHAPPYTLACRSADRLTDNVSLGDVPPGGC